MRLYLIPAALLLAACAHLPPPVSVDEALAMSKRGDTPDAIIAEMRASRSSYRLTASDIIRLHEQGMPQPVLDYMNQTQLDEVQRRQQQADWENDRWPPYRGWGWWRW
ncbi:MAG: hypothetical protein JO142_14165 [Burkholderiales bacterium]|nr:hypothetical protein [Burkholderiales bacterium]